MVPCVVKTSRVSGGCQEPNLKSGVKVAGGYWAQGYVCMCAMGGLGAWDEEIILTYDFCLSLHWKEET